MPTLVESLACTVDLVERAISVGRRTGGVSAHSQIWYKEFVTKWVSSVYKIVLASRNLEIMGTCIIENACICR